jgi:hypothetical protein
VPDSVPLVPVPDEIVAELPQFLNYSFFVDGQQELVILDPATRQIKALVPISGGSTVEVRSRTDGERAGGSARSSETQRLGASARPDTERSNGAASSRSAPPARKRMTREVEQGDDTGDIPSEKTQRLGASARPDTERSNGAASSRSAPPARKRMTREVEQGDESTGDIPRKNLTQTDRQQRSTIQNRSERRKTVRTETDVTVGRAEPETVEIERDRPVLPPPPPPPPVRQYRRVEREDGGPAQTRPVDRGPFGLFGLFDIFR